MSKFEQADTVESLSALPSEGPDAESVLLLSPEAGGATEHDCLDNLCDHQDDAAAFVFVTLTRSPNQRLQLLRDRYGQLPDRTSVVCSAESLDRPAADFHGVDVTTITDPSDLARLGVRISDVLSDWSDYKTNLCFHSLTALVRLVDLSRVFRFIYTLDGRITSSGARAHYHLDPEALDHQTVATLRPLFDWVIEVNNESNQQTGSEDAPPTGAGDDSQYDPWEQLFD